MNHQKQREEIVKNLVIAVMIFTGAMILEYILGTIGLEETEIIVNTMSVVAIVWYTDSFVLGTLSAVIVMAVFSYLHIEPLYSLQVQDPASLVMLITMTVVALLTSVAAKNTTKTERLASEKELESIRSRERAEREQYRANLLRSISHDIRTPLTGIIGTSEMLMSSLDEEDTENRALTEKIQNNARWLHSLVENILNMTRLQDDGFRLKKEPEAMEEIVGVAIGRVLEQRPGREIEPQIPDEFIMAPMDAKLIEQVIINLLENAVKHSDQKDAITVGIDADHASDEVWCSVKDSGKGLTEEELANIFHPFYTGDGKADGIQRSEKEGTLSFGLGLSICKTIVKAHGGTIMARNREDGRGAEFLFSLPLESCGEASK